MGRRSRIPSGDAFLPGTSAGELKALSRKENDARNAKRYTAAHHRKMGKSVNYIAEAVCEEYETVRLWLARCHREGVSGIPRRKSTGRNRLLSREQRIEVVKDVHKGPREAGYESDVWTYKDIWMHIKKKYGVDMTYASAVHNLHEMGVTLKVPRPQHPRAASEEERAEFQRETRKKVLRLARDGFVPLFEDEVHLQAYGNTRRTAGLRGVEVTAPSAVERARLSMFGGVGNGFYYLMEAPKANGTEFVWFCLLLHELFGKVQLVLDHASYHNSKMVKKFVAKCRDWLRLHFTLKYTPNDNAAEGQWIRVKSALANKALRSSAHMSDVIGKAVRAGEVPPVAAHKYAKVATARVGGDDAAEVAARVSGGHEHFCHADPPPAARKRVRIPTADDLRRDREEVLTPEKLAALPRQLAESGLPDKFLANPPLVLLAE